MDESAITVRYSKAFFSLAKEKNLLPQLREDMELISSVSRESKDFILLLESPVVKTSKKTEILRMIFKDKINQLSMDFLELIIRNKRDVHIPDICRHFLTLTRKDQNIQTAVITTATALNPETKVKIALLLEKELKVSIELTEKVNPSIIGGLILRLDDKQYDASVATQLKRIKQRLLETEIK